VLEHILHFSYFLSDLDLIEFDSIYLQKNKKTKIFFFVLTFFFICQKLMNTMIAHNFSAFLLYVRDQFRFQNYCLLSYPKLKCFSCIYRSWLEIINVNLKELVVGSFLLQS
jgi:hypothetical protein